MIKYGLKVYILLQAIVLTIVVLKEQTINGMRKYIGLEVFFTCLLFTGVVITLYYLFSQKKVYELACCCGAILCYGAMMVIPVIPIRIMIPMILLLFPAIATILMEFIIASKRYLLYLPLAMLLIDNMYQIWPGYMINQPLQKQNWETMQEVSAYVQQGNSVPQVHLSKMYKDTHTGIMSYMENMQWSEMLMCKYFSLPNDTEFIWEDADYIEFLWVNRDENGNLIFDENGSCMASFAPCIPWGNEVLYIDDDDVTSIIEGEDFCSFSIL